MNQIRRRQAKVVEAIMDTTYKPMKMKTTMAKLGVVESKVKHDKSS